MGKVVKIRVNEREIPVKMVKKLEHRKIHKYIDIFKGKDYIKKGSVNTLKIWCDVPIKNG